MKKLIILIFIVNSLSLVFAQNGLTIGILNDKETSDSEPLLQKLKKDITDVVGLGTKVTFNDVLYNNSDIELARKNYNSLLDNSDIIISFGVVNTVMLYKEKTYTKPTIIVGAINSDIVNIPKDQITSTINNLTYLITPFSYKDDLDAFTTVLPYRKIGVVIDDYVLGLLPVKNQFDNYFSGKTSTYKFIVLDESKNIDTLFTDIDAVYLVSKTNLDDSEFDNLIAVINEKKIPSFSAYGLRDVERGVLITNQTGVDFKSIVIDSELAQILSIKNYGTAIDCQAPDAADVILRVRLFPFRDGKHLLQARDVTKMKNLEQVRRDFVANASHELRTPISILYGYLEMMRQDDEKGISDEWKPAISQMHDQTIRVKSIIDDMMILSRLEDQEIGSEHEFIKFKPLLESAAKDAEILSKGKHHTIKTDIKSDDSLLCNSEEIKSLVSNIISNAIRYTPDNGTITIQWQVDSDMARLSVRDTGIGIKSEDIPRITERFYRTDTAHSRESGGTGLGLAIVNHICIRHQASLQVESELSKGSVFIVAFPCERIRKHLRQIELLLN